MSRDNSRLRGLKLDGVDAVDFDLNHNDYRKINESFKFRTLTPSQFVQEVNASFDDVNDPVRPVGTGSYTAFVAFFALVKPVK